MTDAKHSPLPWEISNDAMGRPKSIVGASTGRVIDGCDARAHVARISNTGQPYAAANASFIIRAVNSHAALVEALRDVLSCMQSRHADLGVAIQQARAALALAEKEST